MLIDGRLPRSPSFTPVCAESCICPPITLLTFGQTSINQLGGDLLRIDSFSKIGQANGARLDDTDN
jgi:hypothetical protein